MATTYDLDRMAGMPAGERGCNALLDSAKRFEENEYIDLKEGEQSEPPKFWPSTIGKIDLNIGGFYGLTTLAAEAGTGKTLIANASAIEAAASGRWQVVQFLAEDDMDGYRDRFNRYLEAHEGARDCFGNLHVFAVGLGQTLESITMDILHAVDRQADLPILVVIDSINTLVNLGHGSYLAELARYSKWAMYARRRSRGDVSFLITSETNKRGESKGEQLGFWSDFYLKMKKETDSVVSMYVSKTRRTSGEGPLGKFVRNWVSQEFVSDAASWTPRIVETA